MTQVVALHATQFPDEDAPDVSPRALLYLVRASSARRCGARAQVARRHRST